MQAPPLDMPKFINLLSSNIAVVRSRRVTIIGKKKLRRPGRRSSGRTVANDRSNSSPLFLPANISPEQCKLT